MWEVLLLAVAAGVLLLAKKGPVVAPPAAPSGAGGAGQALAVSGAVDQGAIPPEVKPGVISVIEVPIVGAEGEVQIARSVSGIVEVDGQMVSTGMAMGTLTPEQVIAMAEESMKLYPAYADVYKAQIALAQEMM